MATWPAPSHQSARASSRSRSASPVTHGHYDCVQMGQHQASGPGTATHWGHFARVRSFEFYDPDPDTSNQNINSQMGGPPAGGGPSFSTLLAPGDSIRGSGGTGARVWYFISVSGGAKIVGESSTRFGMASVASRSATAPVFGESIDGDFNTIWYLGNNSTIYELSTTDFSTVRTGTGTNGLGIGGDAYKLWLYDSGGTISELSVVDFTVTQSSSIGATFMNAGGSYQHIWLTSPARYTNTKNFACQERSPVDLTFIVNHDWTAGASAKVHAHCGGD